MTRDFGDLGDQLAALEQDADEDVETSASEQSDSAEDPTPPPRSQDNAFQNALQEKLEMVEEGDLSRNATAYDGLLAALLAALEESPERKAEVSRQLADALGRDDGPDDAKKSHLLAMAARNGLRDASPDVMEELIEARAERLRQL